MIGPPAHIRMRNKKEPFMNKLVNSIAYCAFILVAVGSGPHSGAAQVSPSEAYPLVSSDVYEHILDEVFALKEPETRQLQYSLVLRFMTSKHAESELILFVLRDGRAHGTLFQVSGPSVWTIANEYIQRTGNTDVRQIAKQVQVAAIPLRISPDQAERWYADLMRNIGRSAAQLQLDMTTLKKTDKTTIFLDGSTYELWLRQGLTEIHWTMMDDEVDNNGPAGRSPVARWMNDVRRYALSHAAK